MPELNNNIDSIMKAIFGDKINIIIKENVVSQQIDAYVDEGDECFGKATFSYDDKGQIIGITIFYGSVYDYECFYQAPYMLFSINFDKDNGMAMNMISSIKNIKIHYRYMGDNNFYVNKTIGKDSTQVLILPTGDIIKIENNVPSYYALELDPIYYIISQFVSRDTCECLYETFSGAGITGDSIYNVLWMIFDKLHIPDTCPLNGEREVLDEILFEIKALLTTKTSTSSKPFAPINPDENN